LAAIVSQDGTFLTTWGHFGSGEGEFNGSGTLVLDGTGNLYVGDGNGRIQKFQMHPPLVPAAIATPAS
jgi:tripartite motif-containing protein 71